MLSSLFRGVARTTSKRWRIRANRVPRRLHIELLEDRRLLACGGGEAAIDFATFLGGSGSEIVRGFVRDAAGYLYVAGRTESDNLPTSAGVLDATYNGAVMPLSLSSMQPVQTCSGRPTWAAAATTRLLT